MTWNQIWQRACSRIQIGRRSESENDIRQELMFHFRELVGEHLKQGMTFDAAWDAAESRFGSVPRYESECHVLRLEHRLNWLVATATVVLCLAVYRFAFSIPQPQINEQVLRQLKLQERFLSDRISSLAPPAPSTDKAEPVVTASNDLTGRVTVDDRPLADATVQIILKTWPGGHYQQEDFIAQTDENGHFLISSLIPREGMFAIHAVAMKDGFTFQSNYQFIKNGRTTSLNEIHLQLSPAIPVTFVVRDAGGNPLPGVRIIPAKRKRAGEEESIVYFQGSERVGKQTDSDGRVQLACFQPDDQGGVFVCGNDQSLSEVQFTVDRNNPTIIVAPTNLVSY